MALPVCLENSKMVFRYIKSLDALKKGLFSALEPDDTCEKFQNSPRTICIIPAIAFDKKGFRLGYGKGYYDRYLARYPKCKTIAVGFDLQVIQIINHFALLSNIKFF